MAIENIDILKDEGDPHATYCRCVDCIAKSEAFFNGTSDHARNFPDSDRKVKDRRPRIEEMPNP